MCQFLDPLKSSKHCYEIFHFLLKIPKRVFSDSFNKILLLHIVRLYLQTEPNIYISSIVVQ